MRFTGLKIMFISALRGTSRFCFAGVANAPDIELSLFKHKERARVSALRFSWALIEQRKRNNPLCASGGCCIRPCLGSLCSVQCNAGRCEMLRAMQRWGGCKMLRTVQRYAQCSAGRSEALGAVKRWALCSAVWRWALCSAGHCVALRAVYAWFACCDRPCLGSLCSVKCSAGRCAMLHATQCWRGGRVYNVAHCKRMCAVKRCAQ